MTRNLGVECKTVFQEQEIILATKAGQIEFEYYFGCRWVEKVSGCVFFFRTDLISSFGRIFYALAVEGSKSKESRQKTRVSE